jgi:hypothetical protein
MSRTPPTASTRSTSFTPTAIRATSTNGLHHMFYRGGMLFRSDGTPIRALSAGSGRPKEGTTIFRQMPRTYRGRSRSSSDAAGRPHGALFRAGGFGGSARGARGATTFAIAWLILTVRHGTTPRSVGGSRLYAARRTTAGSSRSTGRSLHRVPVGECRSGARHAAHQRPPTAAVTRAVRGHEQRPRQSWSFTALTRDSSFDRLRPMVVRAPTGRKILISLCGTYSSFRSYQQARDWAVLSGVLARRTRGRQSPAGSIGARPSANVGSTQTRSMVVYAVHGRKACTGVAGRRPPAPNRS